MKILVAGLGSIGQRHVRNLRYVLGNDVEILAYRAIGNNIVISEDMTAKSDVNLEQAYNIKSFTNYEEALEQNPAAVFITCPNNLHVPLALQAARSKCHLFIEKPLSNSMEGLEELAKLIEEGNLVTLVGYQMRFHPCLQLVRKLLEENKIGRVLSVRADFGEYLPGTHSYEDYRKGYVARKDLGGGALLCLSHEFDYLQWLFGMPGKLFALGGKLSRLEMDTEDVVDVLMECVTGTRRIPANIHLDYLQSPPSKKCVFIGEEGKIYCDYNSNLVELYTAESKRGESFRFDNFKRNDMFINEMKHFIACLRGDEKSSIDIYESMKGLRIALAAQRSLKSCGVVEDI
jgi:predicted dehydrogenase